VKLPPVKCSGVVCRGFPALGMSTAPCRCPRRSGSSTEGSVPADSRCDTTFLGSNGCPLALATARRVSNARNVFAVKSDPCGMVAILLLAVAVVWYSQVGTVRVVAFSLPLPGCPSNLSRFLNVAHVSLSYILAVLCS
jgi:hypothetical protein